MLNVYFFVMKKEEAKRGEKRVERARK